MSGWGLPEHRYHWHWQVRRSLIAPSCMLQLFNTYSRQLEEFRPLDPAGRRVKLYTCGPTVYNHAHIGNFRAYVFEDLLLPAASGGPRVTKSRG